MFKFFKRLFCEHWSLEFHRNVYGDEINELNCRSLWVCTNCGALRKELYLWNPEVRE